MRNQCNDSKREHVHAVPSRCEALITGAAMVAAPFRRSDSRLRRPAQVANTGVPVGRPAHAHAGRSGHGDGMVEVRQRQGQFKYSPLAQIGRDSFNRLRSRGRGAPSKKMSRRQMI